MCLHLRLFLLGVSMDSLGQASRFYLRLLCLKTTDCCWRRWVIISFCLFLAFKSKSIRVFLTDVTSCWLPPRMSGMKIILLCSLWSLGPVGQILITRASVTERNIFIFFLAFFFVVTVYQKQHIFESTFAEQLHSSDLHSSCGLRGI